MTIGGRHWGAVRVFVYRNETFSPLALVTVDTLAAKNLASAPRSSRLETAGSNDTLPSRSDKLKATFFSFVLTGVQF